MKKNLFKTTPTPSSSPDAPPTVKIEPLSPSKFYGRKVASLQIYSTASDRVKSSPKTPPYQYYGQATRRLLLSKDAPQTPKRTELLRDGSSPECSPSPKFAFGNDWMQKSPKHSPNGSAADRSAKDAERLAKLTVHRRRPSDDLPDNFCAQFVKAFRED